MKILSIFIVTLNETRAVTVDRTTTDSPVDVNNIQLAAVLSDDLQEANY